MPSVERLLHDCAERLEKHRCGRRAVVINLSRLRPDNRGTQQIRIAANTFETLVKPFGGQIFPLQQGDIVFICKDSDFAAVDEAVSRLRYLFGDDPLAAHLDDIQADGFATWYDLGQDYGRFVAFTRRLYKEEQRRQKRLAAFAGEEQRSEKLAMDPPALAELINAIARADLSNVLRRQAVCTIRAGEPPMPVYREIYVSIRDLRDAVMPRRDIASDRWLFQYLTQTLDKRVLALMRRNDDSMLAHSYSLNLNVSTLLSPEFLEFDRTLRGGARGSIVIELEKLEIFADLGAYIFARDFVRERGYRVCLDGVTAVTLPFIDCERWGLDLVKLFWHPDMTDAARGSRMSELYAAIERIGKPRIILARCDSPEAVRFGQACGLRLFQGRHIDRLLATAGNLLMPGRLAPLAAVPAR